MPKPNENADLENICKESEHAEISLSKAKDNLHTLEKKLGCLIRKIKNKEIIIKPADKDLPHKRHIKNSYHYGTIISNDFTYSSFDFKNRLDEHFPNGTTLSTCDIKLLYTNIRHDLFSYSN